MKNRYVVSELKEVVVEADSDVEAEAIARDLPQDEWSVSDWWVNQEVE